MRRARRWCGNGRSLEFNRREAETCRSNRRRRFGESLCSLFPHSWILRPDANIIFFSASAFLAQTPPPPTSTLHQPRVSLLLLSQPISLPRPLPFRLPPSAYAPQVSLHRPPHHLPPFLPPVSVSLPIHPLALTFSLPPNCQSRPRERRTLAPEPSPRS